jgi:hypothetical protein
MTSTTTAVHLTQWKSNKVKIKMNARKFPTFCLLELQAENDRIDWEGTVYLNLDQYDAIKIAADAFNTAYSEATKEENQKDECGADTE